jgi:folate-binding protein YgfZ
LSFLIFALYFIKGRFMTQATILTNRGVLKISGKDRAAFLQGLITNDVNKITQEQGIYAALLSPQGKFQYDLFIVACQGMSGQDVWLMDCDRDRANMLLKRLSLYKLRSEVTIENVSDHFAVATSWESYGLSPSQVVLAKPLDEGCGFTDPRLTELGARYILPVENMNIFFESQGIILTSYENYDYHRIKLGIPDGNRDVLVDRGILLECGFDELNAIDWNKGCYMGQELTARTRYRGLVRKRLMPVHIEGDIPPYQTPIFQNGVEVGEMRSTAQDWGIAMMRLEALHKSLPFSCGSATVSPHVPQWMCLPSLDHEE